MKIQDLTIQTAAQALREKQISSVELTKEFFKFIESSEDLNIFVTKTTEQALEAAKQTDTRIAKGEMLSILDGIPITHKDIFLTKGVRTTNSSKMLEDFIAPYESTVSQKLKDSGSVMLGKVNMDEFAMGSGNETSCFGPTINPWKGKNNKKNVPGGSSGASAASVAASFALGSTGTDTGGSIRQPASFCGIVGIKPTYGSCSRYGIISFASSLDQAGPLTKNVTDSAIMLNHMVGFDPKDPTMYKKDFPDFTKFLDLGIKDLKIGYLKEHLEGKLDSDIKDSFCNSLEIFKKGGAKVKELSLPEINLALPTYYIIAPVEASSNYARFDGIRFGCNDKLAKDIEDLYVKNRSNGFGDEVRRRIVLGAYILSSEVYETVYIRGAKVRRLLANKMKELFNDIDVLVSPTTPTTAFEIGQKVTDPIINYLNDLYTVPLNLVGLPGLSMPVALDKKEMPIGLQIIANHYREDNIYQVARFLEKEVDFKDKPHFLR